MKLNSIFFVSVFFVAFSLSTTNAQTLTLEPSQSYYIATDRLNVRSSLEMNSSANILGQVLRNDLVLLVSIPSAELATPLVEVQILESKNFQFDTTKSYFISRDYLSKDKTFSSNSDYTDPTIPSKYFIVQNVATEMARVYERCTTSPDCPHRLVYETEMVVGRTTGPKDDPKAFLTWLGHFKVLGWSKYYEDNAKHYPSWYNPDYPEMPFDTKATDWLGKKYLPSQIQGAKARGAFGWYAAFVGPNANSQWMHGTFGWGHDQDKFIRYTRNLFVNMVSDPRSSGCTRLENQAIAYLKEFIDPGTDVLRVYALEAFRDADLKSYENQKQPLSFDWILTKELFKNKPLGMAREDVLARNLPADQIMEEGTYLARQYPTGIGYGLNPLGIGATSGITGDTYHVRRHNFRGVFLVDEGRFVNYAHPNSSQLKVGGFKNWVLPDYVKTQGSDFKYAKPYTEKNDLSIGRE